MSRPTTRGKNKKNRQGDDVDTTSEILRKIHTTSQISRDEINMLYKVSKSVCQGCRVNTKDNPNCFCGLIPPPNGSRKSGLWQKTSEILEALGPDPSDDLRVSTDTPAGLTNLGATCYANSILQCLYMNKSFREGIFSVEPALLKQQPVLGQLVRLFAELHVSKMAFIDSSPFVKTLELDNGVQQDSHEFLTLLLSLLERCLSHSNISTSKTIVQDIFRGSVSHVTMCSQCGKASEASSNVEDFYEVELNVRGLKSLDESLDDYLSLEELHGDNQYFCESCKTRVDATRSIKLRTLPRVLNFQLKRCVFLPKTTTKKKITSAFSFPGELDMHQRLSEASQFESIYDLSAVLIHKGTAVNSGHYVAHIKDQNTGQWWEFDDEQVSDLGRHPFGEGSSSLNSKPARTDPVASSTHMEPASTISDGDHKDAVEQQTSEPNTGSHIEIFSSNDAYMLMYNLRCSQKDVDKKHVVCGANGMEVDDDMASLHNGVLIPSYLCEELENFNASYADACQKYKLKKEMEMNQITERKKEVRTVINEAPVRSLEEPFYWISTDWLRQWADTVTPLTLDNTSIQCSHGKAPVSKVGFMKRLSTTAWTILFSKYKGGPELANDDYCMDCLIDEARTLVSADSYRDRRTLMKQIAEDALAGRCRDGTFYVSKSWLQQWLKRKILDAPSEADAGPTIPIRCPHSHLMPEQAVGAKRLLIPENLWSFLYEDAVSVKHDDLLGCPAFTADSKQCSKCEHELSEMACLEDSLRMEKLKQRQNHEKLASGKSFPLSLNCKYYMVPSSWLLKWRNYINAIGKNASSTKPETLDSIIDLLRCEKHSLLIERPPDLIWKRGSVFPKPSTSDGLTIITENDWKCFCKDWNGHEEKCISAQIELRNSTGNNSDGTCLEMPVCEDDLGSPDETTNETESREPQIKTCPEICEACIGERESLKLMQKLNYSDEDIYVCFVRGKEAPKSIIEASETTFDPDRRISKRSRKTNSGNQISLRVSGSTTIYQLKMMIWESFGVVKENQILHKGTQVIDKECATLADMNIFPGDMLWMIDSEVHENRDIADELSDQRMEVENAEKGFHGTLLTASVSSQLV